YRPTHVRCRPPASSFFFFPAPAPPEIYTLSLHDALPISYFSASHLKGNPSCFSFSSASASCAWLRDSASFHSTRPERSASAFWSDRKSTRLNSSHVKISYAVFCLKKKKKAYHQRQKIHAQ